MSIVWHTHFSLPNFVKWNTNKNKATQAILEIIKESKHFDQFLIFEIAEKLGLDKEKTLRGKLLQLGEIDEIRKRRINS